MYNIGTVELIKNGNKEMIDIIVNKESVVAELKYLEGVLEAKAKQGYSSILNIKNISKNFKTKQISILDSNVMTIFIAENIDLRDHYVIMNDADTKTKRFDSVIIKNYVERNGHKDYDLYDYKQNLLLEKKEYSEEQKLEVRRINALRRPSKILDLFLRKKLGRLNPKEIREYSNYEKFNLENILFSNNRHKYSLNNGDAGVITIFEDCEYKTPVTKMQHGAEKDAQLSWYRNDTGDHRDDPNYIYIQVMSEEVICWLPENINEYQVNKMKDFIGEIKDLQNIHHDVKIYSSVVTESAKYNTSIKSYDSLSQLEKHLDQQENKSK